ncbi:GM25405 [Drosophila sechellia]|uniref:GM25405 n=1 Tax=Drosophila sechellia TaxID=7238 RepID=B4HGQ4_DROSE|nr:GM25405 [Drosophila sechellia]
MIVIIKDAGCWMLASARRMEKNGAGGETSAALDALVKPTDNPTFDKPEKQNTTKSHPKLQWQRVALELVCLFMGNTTTTTASTRAGSFQAIDSIDTVCTPNSETPTPTTLAGPPKNGQRSATRKSEQARQILIVRATSRYKIPPALDSTLLG